MSDLTLTGAQLLEARVPLSALGGFAIPNIKGSYALARLKRKAQTELEDLEQARLALCIKHATQENGEPVKLPDDTYDIRDLKAFQVEWTALLAETVTLTNCRAIKASEFDGATQLVRRTGSEPPEIIRGIPADFLFALGPLVLDDLDDVPAVPQPAVPAK